MISAAVCTASLLFATVPVFEGGTVQTWCGGVPVKSFGGTWIYAGAPDLLDDISFQKGNATPREATRGQTPRNPCKPRTLNTLIPDFRKGRE